MKIIVKRLMYFFIGVLIITIAACTPQANPIPNTGSGQIPTAGSPVTVTPTLPPTVSATPTNLVNTYWELVSFGKSGEETAVLEGTNITLNFEANGQAGGSGGCNSFGAQYAVQNGTISFQQISSTKMACTTAGVMDQEQGYFNALQTTGAFDLAGDHLAIWYDNGSSALNFTRLGSPAAQPPTPGEEATPVITNTLLPGVGQPTLAPQRITFAHGETSATVSGVLAHSGSDLYLLQALGDQTMTVALSFSEGQATRRYGGRMARS
jgi:heat shock protein HslJ